MKIVVIGLGYVGLANALFLANHHYVTGYDQDEKKTNQLLNNLCPVDDQSIKQYLLENGLKIKIATTEQDAYHEGDIYLIATSTDFRQGQLNIDSIKSSLSKIKTVNNPLVIIRSTLPIGSSQRLQEQHPKLKIVFMPEFLREGSAINDVFHPSRLIVGSPNDSGQKALDLFMRHLQFEVPVMLMSYSEAEAVKLFSNAYLGMRVAFFNELDNLATQYQLSSRAIIDGLGHDQRIGHFYNNPSFGFSGYCLPKDIKQLNAQFGLIPHDVIKAIFSSNQKRILAIVKQIKNEKKQPVGIYRLTFKKESHSFRHTVLEDIIKLLKKERVPMIIYEPNLASDTYLGLPVVDDLNKFLNEAQLIVANRLDEQLKVVADKVFTRDLYGRDK